MMKYDSESIKTILQNNEAKKLVLPNFQRGFVWDENNQRKLIATLFLGLPIGNVLMLQGTKDDFSARDLCTPDTIVPRPDCVYLLDGQQRISTLKSICSDPYPVDAKEWRETFEKIFPRVRKRWFLKVVPDNGDIDIFNHSRLDFDHAKISKLEPSMIENLFIAESIWVKNANYWYHPAFSPKDRKGDPKTERLKRDQIAKEACAKGIVPLYELFTEERTDGHRLHSLVLQKIASERAVQLQQITLGNKDEIVEILGNMEPYIEEYLDNDEQDKINYAWTRLSFKWAQDVVSFFQNVLDREIAEIILPADQIHRAFAIFEGINRGGTPLDEYDLVVARSARQRDLEPLTQRIIEKISNDNIDLPEEFTHHLACEKPKKLDISLHKVLEANELSKYFKRQFLNLLSIFSHTNFGELEERDSKTRLTVKIEHIKREKILSIPYEAINKNTNLTVTALMRAIAFLNVRCGIVGLSDLHYQLMILPIAYAISDDDIWSDRRKLDKIEYWYWASFFSGAYQFDQNKTAVNDISDLFLWLTTDSEKFKIRYDEILQAQKFSTCDILLCKDSDNLPAKAIRLAILQYVLSKQPRDFLVEDLNLSAWGIAQGVEITAGGKTRTLKIDEHHICPLRNVSKLGESTKELRNQKNHILNSPLNMTYISSLANGLISARTPEDYFKYVSEPAKFGHCIPMPIEDRFQRADTETDGQYYERILKERYEALKQEIRQELLQLVA